MLRYHAACGGPAPTGLQMLLLFAIHSRASETAFWGPYFRFCPQAYDDPLWCETKEKRDPFRIHLIIIQYKSIHDP